MSKDGDVNGCELYTMMKQMYAEQIEQRREITELSHALQSLLGKLDDSLKALKQEIQGIEGHSDLVSVQSEIKRLSDCIEANALQDIRSQNRRIRKHIPFAFQPAKGRPL